MKERWKHIAGQYLTAFQAGRTAARTGFSGRTDFGRRNLLLACLISSTGVLAVDLYRAYQRGSFSEVVVVVLLWGVLAPFLAWWFLRRKARRTSSENSGGNQGNSGTGGTFPTP